MVEFQFETTQHNVSETTTEELLIIGGNRSVFVSVDVQPSIDPSEPNLKNYDFLLASSGNAGAFTRQVKHRSIAVNNINSVSSPQTIASFFTQTLVSGDFFPIPRDSKGDQKVYDLFFISAFPSTVAQTLTVITLDVLPGEFLTIPETANTIVKIKPVLRDMLGLIRRYDVFILEEV